jgi:uncharacterized membrane protein YccF (DUF307 family)
MMVLNLVAGGHAACLGYGVEGVVCQFFICQPSWDASIVWISGRASGEN